MGILRELNEPSSPHSTTQVADRDDSEEEIERSLICKECGAFVTTDRDRTSKSGKHLHTFFNPAGIVYEIGCFHRAPGCLADGPLSREFSWFGGYSWQIIFCTSCIKHLGWFFSSPEDSFYGLIVNRLRES